MPGDDFDTELENLIGGAKKAAAPVVARAAEEGGAAKDAFDHELAGLVNRAPAAPEPKTPPFPEQAPATGEKYVRGLQSRDIEQPPAEPPGAWYSRFLPKLDTSGKTDLSNLYGAGSFLGAQDEVSGAVTNALPSPKDPEGLHREYAAGTRAQDTKDWVLRQQDKAFKEDPVHAYAGAGMAMGAAGLAEGGGLAAAAPSVARAVGPAAAKWVLPSVAGLAGATASDIAHREGTLGDRSQQVVDNLAEHPFMNPETIGAALPAAGTAAAPYLARAAAAAKRTSNKLLTHIFMDPGARAKYEAALGQNALPELGQRVRDAGLADVPWYRSRTAGALKENAYALRNQAVETMAPIEADLARSQARVPIAPIADELAQNAASMNKNGLLPSSGRDARFLEQYSNRLRKIGKPTPFGEVPAAPAPPAAPYQAPAAQGNLPGADDFLSQGGLPRGGDQLELPLASPEPLVTPPSRTPMAPTGGQLELSGPPDQLGFQFSEPPAPSPRPGAGWAFEGPPGRLGMNDPAPPPTPPMPTNSNPQGHLFDRALGGMPEQTSLPGPLMSRQRPGWTPGDLSAEPMSLPGTQAPPAEQSAFPNYFLAKSKPAFRPQGLEGNQMPLPTPPEGVPVPDALAAKRKLYEDINYLRQNSSPVQEMAKKRVAHRLKEGVENAVRTELPDRAAAYAKANKDYGVASEVLDPAIKLAEKNAEMFSPSELGLASAIGPTALATTGAARGLRTMLPSTASKLAAGASNVAQGGSWISKFLARKAGTVGASTATTAAAIRDRNKATKDELNSLLDRGKSE